MFMKEINTHLVELNHRHIQESGRLFARFLIQHPDIDPNFVDDMTEQQDSEWSDFSSDLKITQQIEINELLSE